VHPTNFLPTPSPDNPINSPSMSSTPQETLGNYKRNKWERVLYASPQFLHRKFVQPAQTQLLSSNGDAFDKCSQDIELGSSLVRGITWIPMYCLQTSQTLRFLSLRQTASPFVLRTWTPLQLVQIC
jgi:hypothetical protein